MKHLEKYLDKSFWQKVRNNPEYADVRAAIYEMYEKNRYDDIPAIPYSKRWLYHKVGSRDEFEKYYFRIRYYLTAATILALMEPENDHYITEVQDVLWALCDEYSWALPAHSPGRVEGDIKMADLFSTETGADCCKVLYLLKSRLDTPVVERVKREVHKRVLIPHKEMKYRWERCYDNWAAVCGANVTECFLFLDKELFFSDYYDRMAGCIQQFIDGYSAEGICLEGLSYWNYGFGHFVSFADMIYAETNGEIDWFAIPKVAKMAKFPQTMYLKGGEYISYADGSTTARGNFGVLALLHQRYPDAIPTPDKNESITFNSNKYFGYVLQNIYYWALEPEQKQKVEKLLYFPDAGQAVFHKDTFSIAMKAGHNNEEHNHNDVGNFIFADEDGQALCDIGAGMYTQQYFSKDKENGRYKVFCTNSYSHNVPIMDGLDQKTGKSACGSISLDGNVVSMEFAKAYGNEKLTGLSRKITVEETHVVLTDSFEGECAVTERFVSLRKPNVEDGKVALGRTTLFFDKELQPVVSMVIHKPHIGNGDIEVYCIDFALPAHSKSFTMQIQAN